MPPPDDDRATVDESGLPRWVKASAAVAAVVVAVVVLVALLAGSGGHGPGRHLPQGSGPADVVEIASSLVVARFR